ncbi:intestinal mucin-like protein [Cololabis saira]|uniref:intestinal mucin-like protein n=1 Tax=Cololabis saira TaxID=129043 RepID=UPI002AD2BFE5|nr:intestinal mucin-like protein [Cololabis saira]
MKAQIKHNGCELEVDMPSCEGLCNTFSKYSDAAAPCCKEMSSRNVTIDLQCTKGGTIPYTYTHVEQCGCGQTPCTLHAEHYGRRKRSYVLP